MRIDKMVIPSFLIITLLFSMVSGAYCSDSCLFLCDCTIKEASSPSITHSCCETTENKTLFNEEPEKNGPCQCQIDHKTPLIPTSQVVIVPDNPLIAAVPGETFINAVIDKTSEAPKFPTGPPGKQLGLYLIYQQLLF